MKHKDYTPLSPAYIPPTSMNIDTSTMYDETSTDNESKLESDSDTEYNNDSTTTKKRSISDNPILFIKLAKKTPIKYIDDNLDNINRLLTSIRIITSTLSSSLLCVLDVFTSSFLTSNLIQDYLRYIITRSIRLQHCVIYYTSKTHTSLPNLQLCNLYDNCFRYRIEEITKVYNKIYDDVLNDYCNQLNV